MAVEPRAWDHMWNRPVKALLRIKLKCGSWMGGIFEMTKEGKHHLQRVICVTATCISSGS
jgi:hypothetical protein